MLFSRQGWALVPWRKPVTGGTFPLHALDSRRCSEVVFILPLLARVELEPFPMVMGVRAFGGFWAFRFLRSWDVYFRWYWRAAICLTAVFLDVII
jgi:hypothetical protein